VNKLTVVIPFCNEGAYLNKTLNSIRLTAEGEVDVIIVDDASNDGLDYKEMAEEYQCTYILNENSIGPSACRDKAMEVVDTPYVLLVDGHMSFYFNDWHGQFIEALEDDSRVVYCANPIPLNRICRRNSNLVDEILLDSNVSGVIADESGKKFILEDDGDSNLIPVLFGGSYALSKEYYGKLGGSNGLNGVGTFNILMSLKVFLEGGEIRFLEDAHIGHIYTDILSYDKDEEACAGDKAIITELFLHLVGMEALAETPEEEKDLIDKRADDLNSIKYFISKNLKERDFHSFIEFQNSFNE